MKKYYYVGRNHCRCHPETCCCNDYAIYYGEKWYDSIYIDSQHSTHYSEGVANEICDLLNKDIKSEVVK